MGNSPSDGAVSNSSISVPAIRGKSLPRCPWKHLFRKNPALSSAQCALSPGGCRRKGATIPSDTFCAWLSVSGCSAMIEVEELASRGVLSIFQINIAPTHAHKLKKSEERRVGISLPKFRGWKPRSWVS
jgi:hypothetical protein